MKLKTHGRTFTGVVISAKMDKTVTVEWARKEFVKKYERSLKKRSRVKAHNPEKINAVNGDIVKIKETRPISKTKHFVIIEKVGKEKLFTEKQRLMEESKHREEEE